MRLIKRYGEHTSGLGSVFSDPSQSSQFMMKQTYYHLTLHSFKFKGGKVNLFFEPKVMNPSYDQPSNEIWQPW